MISAPSSSVGQPEADPLREALVIGAIHRFHEAVGRWFGCEPRDDDMAWMASAMVPGFAWFGPDGEVLGRDATIARIRAARGCHASDGFAIGIEAPAVRWQEGPRVLASYIEWQRWGGGSNRRRAVAAFLVDPVAPGGVWWTEVAEAWIES